VNVGDPVWSAGGWSVGERGVVQSVDDGLARVLWEERGLRTEWKASLRTTPPPEACVIITPAEARDYATALRLHVDPNASVAQREHAAVRVRELRRRLSAVGTG
jgi:hypothetical protein